MSLQDQKEIIEGMSCIISILPSGEKVLAGLQRLLQPMVVELNSYVQAAEQGQNVARTYDATTEILCAALQSYVCFAFIDSVYASYLSIAQPRPISRIS